MPVFLLLFNEKMPSGSAASMLVLGFPRFLRAAFSFRHKQEDTDWFLETKIWAFQDGWARSLRAEAQQSGRKTKKKKGKPDFIAALTVTASLDIFSPDNQKKYFSVVTTWFQTNYMKWIECSDWIFSTCFFSLQSKWRHTGRGATPFLFHLYASFVSLMRFIKNGIKNEGSSLKKGHNKAEARLYSSGWRTSVPNRYGY